MNEQIDHIAQQEEKEIDIFRLVQIFWKWIWLVVCVTMIFGVVAAIYSVGFVTPTYRSFFTAYVNNRMENLEGSGSTTTSDLNASAALTYLYQDIILSRSVLTDAAEKCGLNYDYEKLKSMVSTQVDSQSALIGVYVVDTDPARATMLAQAIADVAPSHVERMREGSSMRILDAPQQPVKKFAPNNTKNAVIGALVGFVLSVACVFAAELLNDKVRDADELERRYNIIVLGVIPSLSTANEDGTYTHSHIGGDKR